MKKQNTFGNRQVLETRYRNSRSNLLLVVAFTLINIVLLITKSNRFFLFSAYAPYVIVDFGMLICGMYPPEYYGEDSIIATTLPASVFTVFVVIASIILTLYFVSWLLSKNKPG